MGQRAPAAEPRTLPDPSEWPEITVVAWNVRLLRARPGWQLSQIDLAKRAGLGEKYVQSLEVACNPDRASYVTSPSLDSLSALARALGIPTRRLLEPPTPPYLSGDLSTRPGLRSIDGGRTQRAARRPPRKRADVAHLTVAR